MKTFQFYRNGLNFYFQKHTSFSHTTFWIEIPFIGLKLKIKN